MDLIDPLESRPSDDAAEGSAPEACQSPHGGTPADDGATSAPGAERTFRELIEMLRSGVPDLENEAIRLLHRNYYAALRVVIRGILNSHPELNKMEETNVFWDSLIMALRHKQVNLEHTNPILLLKTILKRKMINEIHHLETDRQGGKAVLVPITSDGVIVGHEPTASQHAIEKELRELIEKKRLQIFTDEERRLIELRDAGRSWDEIGAMLDSTPDAVRVRHDRALKRLDRAIRGMT